MDTPETDPETQPLVGPRDERDGLLLSTPREVESDHGLGVLRADKVNEKDMAQLDDAFLEDPETLDSVAPSSEDEPGPPCFCSTPIQNVEEDSEDDGYEEFRRRLGMELTEPVPRRERNKVMRTICDLFSMEPVTLSCSSSPGQARSKHERVKMLKRKRKETTEKKNSQVSVTDGWMKPGHCGKFTLLVIILIDMKIVTLPVAITLSGCQQKLNQPKAKIYHCKRWRRPKGQGR
ncbi:uncharacterized protein LOC141993509 [Natator depressus]|uniref:uncharacterized protein LOC141993509 n=1 Tax=Natator depressus TaxID=27790 RepID=UPI003EB8E5F3